MELQPRTYLFVPGNRPERFEKALASGADEVIIDLEDAVPPEEKPAALLAAAAWLRDRACLVRVNSAGTPWHLDELGMLSKTDGLNGIVLPKATPATVRSTAQTLDRSVPMLPLLETAEGVLCATEIASMPATKRLLIGTLDLALDLGIDRLRGDEPGLLHARSCLVMASARHGLPGPVDGVHPHLDDEDGLARSVRRGLDIGFSAKLCIHPRQVRPVHDALSPSADDVAWARRIARIAEQVGGRATQHDGEMLDAPQYRRAARILAQGR